MTRQYVQVICLLLPVLISDYIKDISAKLHYSNYVHNMLVKINIGETSWQRRVVVHGKLLSGMITQWDT